MKSRCFRKNNKKFKEYGGRGIKVCERWLKFDNFYEDMGEAPVNMSIDRIDNNGNYEPGNCRWATAKQQNNNKRNTITITANGETKTVAEWCQKLNVSRSLICNRKNRGWTEDEIINIQKRKTIPKEIKRKKIKRICKCGKIDTLLMISKIQGGISELCRSCRMKKAYKIKNQSKSSIGVNPYSKDKTIDSSFDIDSPSPVPE